MTTPALASHPALLVRLYRRIPWGWVGFGVLLLAYLILLGGHYAPAISEPDDNGYFAQGSLLARTGRTWFAADSDAQYIGMHWLLTPSGTYISRYPPGLAVLIAAAYTVGGYQLAALVNPTLSVAALVGLFMLLRQLTSPAWALLGVVLLASNQTFCQHALSGDAHMGVAACLIWGLYFLLRWADERAGGRLWQVFVAGVILGCIPTIRYPDAIMGLGVIVFLAWHWKRAPRIWLHWLVAAAGAAAPIVPLLIRNQRLLGAFWRTGYALTNEQTGFGWDYFQQHAIDYLRTLNATGLGLCFGLGVIGLVTMICVRRVRPVGIMLALMSVPMLLLYMAYYWGPMGGGPGGIGGGMTMRFLLPTFALYLVAGVWVLRELLASAPVSARVAVPVVLAAVQLLWGTRDLLDDVNRLHYQKASLAQVTRALDGVAEPGDVIVADNQVLQQLDFVRKWKLADASLLRGGSGGGPGAFRGREIDPEAPSPMQAAKAIERREKYTGTTSERQAKFAEDVKTWANGSEGRILFVGPESQLRQLRSQLRGDRTEVLTKFTLPEPPAQRITRGGFGGRMPGGGGRGGRGFAGGPGGPGGPGGGPGFGGGPGGPGFAGGPGGFGGPMGRLGGERDLVVAEWRIGPTEERTSKR